MYIQENYIYKKNKSGTFIRVVWLEPNNDYCWLIDFNSKGKLLSWPYECPLSFLTENSKNFEHLEIDKFSKNPPDTISEASENKRRDCYEFIKNVADQKPEIFYEHRRGKIIAEAIEKRDKEIDDAKKKGIREPQSIKKTQAYEILKAYWIYGQSQNSTLPNYSPCGAKGKKRKYAKGAMPGRKKKSISKPQLQLTDANIEQIQNNYPKLVKRAQGNETRAYHLFIGKYWNKFKAQPSPSQWSFHGKKVYKTHKEVEDGKLERIAPSGRILTSSGRNVFGPGSECQLDSTVDNTHVLSRTFNFQYFGRMTLYLGVDTFSAMPMGILLCPLHPSYEALQYLILNMSTPKDIFMKSLGIHDRQFEDWPCKHIAAKYLTDHGPEYTCYNIESWPRNLQTQIDTAPTGRPDLKAVVERYIKKLLDAIQVILENKGLVHQDFGTRMGKDSRKEATLTYHDVLKIIVLEILHQIKYKKISKYPYTEKMVTEGVQAYPLELWNWGRKNTLGSLKEIEPSVVRRNILPFETTQATTSGFNFKGLDFIPTDKEGEVVRRRILNSSNHMVRLSYDETTFEVYLNYESKQYLLKPRLGTKFKSFIEYKLHLEQGRQKDQARKDESFQNRIATDLEQQAVVNKATATKKSFQIGTNKDVTRNKARPVRGLEKTFFRQSQNIGHEKKVTAHVPKLKMPNLTSMLKSIKQK